MGFHTFPTERADKLDDPSRYRYCSIEELLAALDLDGDETVVELGVGTGFFAADIVDHAKRLVGVDIQRPMITRMADREDTTDIAGVVGAIEALPMATAVADVAYSTMTFHEYASSKAHREVRRILVDGGRLVTVDWSADGSGESGPPLDERFALADVVDQLQDVGFHIEVAVDRPETILVVATAA